MDILGLHLNPGGLAAAAAFVLGFGILELVGFIRARRKRAKMRAESAAWRERVRGGRPPMSEADVEDLKRWLAEETMPCAYMALAETPPESDQASRVGGPAWLPQGVDWPVGRSGRPMIFVAQVNFAEAPKLPDFPERGVAMFFLGDGDFWDAQSAHPGESGVRVVYVADDATPGRLVHQPGPRAESSPFESADAETHGRGVRFLASSMKPSDSDWRVDAKWPGWYVRGGDERFDALLETGEGPEEPTYIGGQPTFTQNDPRSLERFSDYDRVLLQVGSSNIITWGDNGEACFLIRRGDLLSRDFNHVLFNVDCH